jgi:murein DD-endopeptidase MepM/ murein hydrolase activator NlpD
MPLIVIAARSTRSAAVRTVSLRALVSSCTVLALLLVAAGAGVGFWASIGLAPPLATATSPVPGLQPHSAASMPAFAAEQLGALSARLFRLESQAGQLGERIRAMTAPSNKARAASAAASGAGSTSASRGGPMLPPRDMRQAPAMRAAPDDLAGWQQRLQDIEQQINGVADAALLQHLALLHLPSRAPLDDAEPSSSFGNREDPLTGRLAFHAGVDFAAPAGSVIRAAAAGIVAFAGFHPAFGWMIEIEHGNQLVTRYAHASRLDVRRGQLVRAGDAVAAVGSSGRSTGPHLHFEVLRQGQPIDPRLYLAGS